MESNLNQLNQNPNNINYLFQKASEDKIRNIYRKHIFRMKREVRAWLKLMQDAIIYGIEQQMILGKEPIEDYSADLYEPTTEIERACMELRADQFAKYLKSSFEKAKIETRINTPNLDKSCLQRILQGSSTILKASPGSIANQITAGIVDWHCVLAHGDRRMARAHMDIYGDAMMKGGRLARTSLSFDVVNEKAVRWASINSNKLVTQIADDTRRMLRTIISDGIRDGKSIPKIAKEMRPLVGLNNPQAKAVQNLRAKLVDAGVKNIDTKVDKYARKMLRLRTETIARTETANSVSAGTLEGYGSSGISYVRFVASGDACSVCSFLDGNVYTLAEADGMITGETHPNCRCCWITARKPRSK